MTRKKHGKVIRMNKDERIVKLKLDVIFKRVFGNEQNEKDHCRNYLRFTGDAP